MGAAAVASRRVCGASHTARMRSFVLLGIGARGADFREWRCPLPNEGHVSWIRWRDRDWGEETWPTLHGRVRPGEPIRPRPPEFSEEWLDESGDAGRFLFNVSEGPRFEDEHDAASGYADAFAGLLSVPAPLGYEPEVVELLPEWIEAGEATVQEVEEIDPRPPLGRAVGLRDTWMFEEELIARVLSLIQPTIDDGDAPSWGAFPAVLYYRLSVSELAFSPSDRQFLCGVDRDVEPETPFERVRLEQSFHNTFKALEALLNGEPPKRLEVLAERLRTRSIDPDDDPVAPDGRGESTAERIVRLHNLRDKASAHGGALGKQRTRLRFSDLMEMQWVVSGLISDVVTKGR